MTGCIGIDVHKDAVVVAAEQGAPWTVARTPAALTALATQLAEEIQPSLIVLEPSGGYERVVMEHLHPVQVPVARVHPRQVRAFIHGVGIKAKADGLDARMLARYGTIAAPAPTALPRPIEQRVADLSQLRRTLRADIAAKTHQCEEQSAEIQASLHRVIAGLEQECVRITTLIGEVVTTTPDWERPRTILASCPGIGEHTVAVLLAELPELGHGSAKTIAALVGVAPMTQQSGRTPGTAAIDGGRRHVRAALWMPTRSAMRHNSVIAAFARRLKAQHKPDKVIVIACMHKLLTMLNAMLAHDTTWTPTLPPP